MLRPHAASPSDWSHDFSKKNRASCAYRRFLGSLCPARSPGYWTAGCVTRVVSELLVYGAIRPWRGASGFGKTLELTAVALFGLNLAVNLARRGGRTPTSRSALG